ncbi:PIN domain-containing protein [Rhodoferax sp.]|uniref:PIN domain-containing protein n=1 Tax=Rhodoferax sp. TaxID=50421 RepID=UPI0026038085|nr:PIN domain-containing protein [Rhodoferax sp.]MDD3936865.1 PIN domain-containing protein [Rhodoferax sp.]
MPKGQPSPDHVIGRKVTFFSIDTNVLEGKGFDFNRGALNVLQHQRPTWMTLRLSDIVEREVFAHRMRDLTEAKQKLDSALNHMRRKAALDVTRVATELHALTVLESGANQFKNELQSFLKGLGGEVLPTSGATLASDLFDRYFEVRPPFELVEDKKFEFPDAAALLVLEQYAKAQTETGVLISNDKGWRTFANQSEHLFCVKSLEEFTGLFAALTEHAKQLLAKIQDSLLAPASVCKELLQDAIKGHVAEAEWSVDEICCGSAHRLEGEAYDASVVDFTADYQSMKGWFTDEDSPMYVVELPVSISVEISVSVAFYQWDSIDHEEIPMGSQDISVPMDIDVSVFLTSSGELMASPVDDWDIEVEIATGNYSVDAGEVELDYGDDEEYDPD